MNGPRERTDLDAIRGRFDAAVADHPPFGAESAFLDHAAEDVAALLGELATVKAERDQAREESAALNGRRILSIVFGHHKGAPRPFALYRRPPARKPQSLVALGAEFPDGAVALRLANDGGWTTKSDGGAETIAANSFAAALEIVWLSDELPALAEMEAALEASEAREAAALRVVDAARAARPTLAYLAGGGRRLPGQLTDLIAAIDALGALPAAEEQGQVSPSTGDEGGTHREVADDEATTLLLTIGAYGLHPSKQDELWAKARALRNRFDPTGAPVVSAPLIGAEEPVSPQPDVKIFGAAPEPPLPQDIPRHSLSLNGRTDEPDEPKWGVEFAVLDGGVHHAYGDQSWVAYGGAIRDEHPNGKVQCRRISISYGPWQDWPAAVPAPLIGAEAPDFPQAAGNESGTAARRSFVFPLIPLDVVTVRDNLGAEWFRLGEDSDGRGARWSRSDYEGCYVEPQLVHERGPLVEVPEVVYRWRRDESGAAVGLDRLVEGAAGNESGEVA